jgi:hypothetical protein
MMGVFPIASRIELQTIICPPKTQMLLLFYNKYKTMSSVFSLCFIKIAANAVNTAQGKPSLSLCASMIFYCLKVNTKNEAKILQMMHNCVKIKAMNVFGGYNYAQKGYSHIN